MNPVDRWWNEHFPPHSVARLMLFYVLLPLPLIGVALYASAADVATFATSELVFTFLGTALTITVVWFLGRMGYGRPLMGDDLAEDTEWVKSPPKREITSSDIAISWAAIFLGDAVLIYSLWPDGSLIAVLGIAALVSVGVLALVALSFSLTVILIATAIISYPFAVLLQLFLYFLSGDEDVTGYWVFTFVLGLSWVLPLWGVIQRVKRQRGWAKLPLIATSVGTALLLGLAGFTLVESESPEPVVEADMAAAEAARRNAQAAPSPAAIGASSPEMAVQQLLTAWRMGYEAGAARVADRPVIEILFKNPHDPSMRLLNCEGNECTAQGDSGTITFMMLKTDSLHRVRYMSSTPP